MLELSPAETQLIALLRHHDIKNFKVVIHVNHNRWTVNLEDQDVGTVRTGSGADFAAAWAAARAFLRISESPLSM